MRLSDSDLEIIRTHPQSSRLNLFIYEPTEVMRAYISNPSATKGDINIRVDGIVTGTTVYNIEDGMSMLVGTESGLDNVGRIRIRSASFTGTSGTFVVSENSNIQWVDGQYITALNYWEIWPVFPRIIQKPNDPTDVIFYKDYDIPYTTQNSDLGTFIVMGSHRARTLDGGQASIYWSSTGTYNLKGESLSFLWAFEGGTPTGSVLPEPGLVNYYDDGNYITKLQVTSASGTVDTSYRYVAIRDKIGQGSNPPFLKWEMKNLSGSRGEGGYSADFVIHENIEINDNAVVMLSADDWYGNNHVSLGGNTKNEPYMFFVGYIDKDSIKHNYRESRVEFTAVSVTEIMKQSLGFSISVESKASPSTWYELLDMDCRRALYHYLRWHSTVLKVTDFEFIGSDYKIQFFDADRTSMFDAIDELMRGTLVGNVCSDRQGRIYAEVEPMAYSNPSGTFTPVMGITRRDWIDEPEIEEVISDSVSYMEYGGIQYLGATLNTFVPLLACAPGTTPSFRGSIDKQQGLALNGQDHLNSLVGNIYANRNSQFPNISMDMSADLRNLDIAPFESVNMNISPSDTVREVTIDGLYIPEGITWKYNHQDGVLLPSIDFKSLVNGDEGDTITIVVPTDGVGSPSFDPISITPIAIPPLITGSLSSEPSTVVLVSDNFGVLYTTNFSDTAPVWTAMNEGLSTGTFQNIAKLVKTGNNKLFIMCDGDGNNGYNSIYYSNGVGQSWNLLLVSDTSDRYVGKFSAICANPTATEEIAVLGGLSSGGSTNPYGQGTWIGSFLMGDSSGLGSTDILYKKGYYRAEIVYTSAGWYVFTQRADGFNGNFYAQCVWVMTPSGIMTDSGVAGAQGSYGLDIGNQNILYAAGSRMATFAMYWSTAVGYGRITAHPPYNYNRTTSTNLNPKLSQPIAFSLSGNRVMGSNSGVYTPYRSLDGGVTWENLSLIIPVGMSAFESCGDENRWIYGGGTNVKYTSSFGDAGSNSNKEGNLSPSFPLINITEIKFIA